MQIFYENKLETRLERHFIKVGRERFKLYGARGLLSLLFVAKAKRFGAIFKIHDGFEGVGASSKPK